MTLPYLFRLICLCAATFFLVHAALGLGLRLAARSIIRFANRMKPREATRFLLFVRFLPLVGTAFVVLGVCLPSYLWLEPRASLETVRAGFVIAAICGASIWISSLLRAGWAVAAARRFAQRCEETRTKSNFPGMDHPVDILDSDAPVLLMAGIVRPRLVLSRAVLSALSSEQLQSALRHEQAHRTSRDNFKRLLLLLSPEIVPFTRIFDPIDRAWAKFSEWAADDDACASDPERSVSLAESLVRVARMGAAPRSMPLCTSFIPPDQDLSARVGRLLRPQFVEMKSWRRVRTIFGGAACIIAALLTVILLRPSLLHSVHELLERLTH
jgi:Zn-dependent protease with chaperone function